AWQCWCLAVRCHCTRSRKCRRSRSRIQFRKGSFTGMNIPVNSRPCGGSKSARAEVARARAQIAVTGSDLERAEQLTPSKVLTQRDFDQRKTNHDAAKAQLQSAEAMLRNPELNLDWTSGPAPIDGRISDRKIDAGNLISGGQVGASLLTTIVSLHPIHFVFNVSEPDYVRYSRLAANGQRPSSSMPSS